MCLTTANSKDNSVLCLPQPTVNNAMNEDEINEEDQLKWEKTDESKSFKKNQIYEEPGSLLTPICIKCMVSDFYIAHGSYYTVIKCKNCGTETCIHDG